MIDIENIVFQKIAEAVEARFPDADVQNTYTEQPAAFPAVTVVEADNSVVKKMATLYKIENAASVMYEVNVFSSAAGGQKTEAKEIINLIDEVFGSYGFARTMKNQVPNFADRRIYRIVARYAGLVDIGDNENYYICQ